MWKKIAFKDGIVWDHCQKYWYTLRKHVFDSKHQIVDYFSDIVSADILFLHCFLVVILFYLSLELAFIFSGSKEAVAHRCPAKKRSLKFRKIHRKTPARVSFLIKLHTRPITYFFIKIILWHMCFPVSFAKFLTTSFVTDHFWWLLP